MFGLTKILKLKAAIKKIKPRISITTAIFMLLFGVVVDLLDIGLDLIGAGFVVDSILAVGAFFTIWVWCNVKGVKFIKVSRGEDTTKLRLVAYALAFLIELIPAVNALPGFTIDVAINILTSWIEDIAASEAAKDIAEEIPGSQKMLHELTSEEAEAHRQGLEAEDARQKGIQDRETGHTGVDDEPEEKADWRKDEEKQRGIEDREMGRTNPMDSGDPSHPTQAGMRTPETQPSEQGKPLRQAAPSGRATTAPRPSSSGAGSQSGGKVLNLKGK